MNRLKVNYRTLLNLSAGIIFACLFLLPFTGVVAEPYLQDSSGMVSIETEHFDDHIPNSGYEWSLDYTSGYSGTAAMKAPPAAFMGYYLEYSPRLDYHVDFLYSGLHYLWVRAYATSKSTDSLHAGLNGGDAAGGANIGFAATGQYVWAVTTLTIPSTGIHTVNLWGRERNAVVDKVVLTTNAGYTPSGFGPPESPRGTGTPTVSLPVIDPAGGSFADGVTVSISTGTSGATIYYTLDGSTPTSGSTRYTGPFVLSTTATLKARGMLSGYNDSSVATANFTITQGSPGGSDAYLQDSNGLVSMETEHFDAHVPNGSHQWTLNYTSGYSGSGAMKAPDAAFMGYYLQYSPRLDYRVDFKYSGLHYLWVRAYATSTANDSLHAGLNGGDAAGGANIGFAATGAYVWAKSTLTIPSVGVHTVNLWGRERNAVVDKVVLTTDAGYVPSGFGPAQSPRGTGAGTVSLPVINPAGGSFVDGVSVSISTATSGASIYYTLDGSTPTAGSTRYTGPFVLSASATVKAKGMLTGYNDSAVASATFTITPGSGPTGAYLQDSNGLVSMETEHFTDHVPNGGYEWTLNYTSGYSGSGAMKAPPVPFMSYYLQYSPRLDYRVNFQYSGLHHLWVRAYATSTANDSLHAGLNGGDSAGGANIGFAATGAYVWAKSTLTIPSTGVHTVNLWGRERDAVVDKVVLTTNAGYVPSGFGPPESPWGDACGTTPSVAIVSPEPGHLQTRPDLTVRTQTCLDSVLHAGWGVKFELDGGVANGGMVAYKHSAPYQTTFSNVSAGEHRITAYIVDAAGNAVSGWETQDDVERIGIGDYYVAVGDSITNGTGDDDPSDNTSLDGRNTGGGYTPILNNLLTQFFGYPHTVINEGLGGIISAQGLQNLPDVLQRHPDAQRVLMQFGMNDARPWLPVPSGLGLSPGDSGYPGTFKDNMQQMINLAANSGKEASLSKTIIALGDRNTGATYPDPNQGARSLMIQQYNAVIDELCAANTGIMVNPPDFYSYFAQHHALEYSDNIHPNGRGYKSMAQIWSTALTSPEY